MSSSTPSPEENLTPESELTPEQQQIIGKARRSFGVSMLILMAGFIAIAGALVYRATRDDGGVAAKYPLAEIALPAGAEVISAVPGDGAIAVTYSVAGVTQLRLIDGETGVVLRDIPVVAE
jgi:hypothetical protein